MDIFEAFVNNNLAECTRCGNLCRIAGNPNPEARLMQYATAETARKNGLCADCATTAFIQSIETLMYGIEQHGVQILLAAHIQQQFSKLMVVGKADANPEDVNWQRVVDNWNLPFPNQKKRGK